MRTRDERPGLTSSGSVDARAGSRLAGVCLVLAVVSTLGCGLSSRVAINTMVPIIEDSVTAAYRNGDVELVEAGIPGNLLLIDGLVANRPNDDRLLTTACRLYFSYAAGFVEGRDDERARALHAKAMAYGLRAFPDLAPDDHLGREGDVTFAAALGSYGEDDVPGLAWLAGAWGSWVKLDIGNTAAMAQVPRVVQLIERLTELDPAFLHGLPYLMLGTLHALRPPMLGGDPEAAKAAFDRGFAVSNGRFLLMHLFYAKYYCRQIFDENLFDSTLKMLLEADPNALPEVLLLNQVAQAQARALLARRNEIF